MRQKLKILGLTLIFLRSILLTCATEDAFNKGLLRIKEGNYPEAISLLRTACSNYTNDYDDTIWKCNFNLAFAYENLASISINGEKVGYLKILKNLVDSAIYYYEKAIRISKLNKKSVQISDVLLLANIKIAMGEFENAGLLLDDLENRMAQTGYPLWEQTDRRYDFIKNIINKFRRAIDIKSKIPLLTGNIGPFGFSSLQIQPSILFISETDSSLTSIRIGYSDFNGNQTDILNKQINNEYNFNKPILLTRIGIFPFDKYTATVYVKGAELNKSILPLSIYEPTFLKGKAFLEGSSVYFEIKRHPISIILFYIFFTISVVGIISLNKAIKNMKLRSFKWKNFEPKYKLIATIVSFIFSLISLFDLKSIWNLYTILLIFVFLITVSRLFKRYHYLYKLNNTRSIGAPTLKIKDK